MRFEFKPSFDRSVKRLDAHRKEKTKRAAAAFVDFIETRIKPEGIGLKHLRGDFWEISAGIKDRIIFRMKKDLVEFIIAGTHDDIRRFLK